MEVIDGYSLYNDVIVCNFFFGQYIYIQWVIIVYDIFLAGFFLVIFSDFIFVVCLWDKFVQCWDDIRKFLWLVNFKVFGFFVDFVFDCI